MALSLQEVIKCLKEKQASLESSNSINGEEYEEWVRQQRFQNEERLTK